MLTTVRLHRVVAATPAMLDRVFLQPDVRPKWLRLSNARRGQLGDAVGRSHTHLMHHSAARSNGAYWGAELPFAVSPSLQFLGAPGPQTLIVRLRDRSDAAPGSGYAH